MLKNRTIKTRVSKTVEDCLNFYLEDYAEDVNLKAKDTMFYI
jgi:histone H3/H4